MRRQIEALTSTRGIAALLVVVFHYGCTVAPFNFFEHFFRSGNLAVGYFFVLSGFVLYWAYRDRIFTYGDFIRRRFARIAPAYYFALLLAISIPLHHLLVQGTVLPERFGQQVLLNAAFIQSFFPGNALSINSPAWSLSIEVFFYCLFPVLLLLSKRWIRPFIWFVVLFFIASQAIHFLLIEKFHPVFPSAIHEFIFYYPLFHLNEFMVGMVGAYLLSKVKARSIRMSSLALFICVILLVNYMPNAISLHNGLLAPVYTLLIMALAMEQPFMLRAKPLVFLGEISYGIYILQEPLHKYAALANDRYFHIPDPWFFYSYLLLLITAAAVSFYIIENPLRKLIVTKGK